MKQKELSSIFYSKYHFPLCMYLVFLSVSSAFSQDKVSLITWTDFNYTYNLSQKLGVGGDAGLRGIVSKPDWGLIYARPTVKYHFTPFFQVAGAVGLFETFQSDASNVTELRLAQEAKVEWPTFRRFYFINRARLEERFLFYADQDASNDYESRQDNYRLRYLLEARSNYFKLAERAQYFYLVASAEYFIPIGEKVDERFFNASRIKVGFGQELKLNFDYQVDFIWQRSRNTLEDDLATDEFVLRLRLFFNQYKEDKTPSLD